MYAIIETGGKQYKVTEGDIIYIEKLLAEADDEVIFDKVLALTDEDGNLTTGSSYVDGAKVTAKVIKNGKSKKIVVMTYKSKKNEKKKAGHRQPYTKVEIKSINK